MSFTGSGGRKEMSNSTSTTCSADSSSIDILIEIVSANLEPENERVKCNTFCILRRCSYYTSAPAVGANIANRNDDTNLANANGVGKQPKSQKEIVEQITALSRRARSLSNGIDRTIQFDVLHQTDTIQRTNSPIWTVNEGSLFLYHLNLLQNNDDNSGRDDNISNNREEILELQVFHSPQNSSRDVNTAVTASSTSQAPSKGKRFYHVGSAYLTPHTLYRGSGERMEHKLQKRLPSESELPCITKTKAGDHIHGTVALRYRIAQPHEIMFMKRKAQIFQEHENSASGPFSMPVFSNVFSRAVNANVNGTNENSSADSDGLMYHNEMGVSAEAVQAAISIDESNGSTMSFDSDRSASTSSISFAAKSESQTKVVKRRHYKKTFQKSKEKIQKQHKDTSGLNDSTIIKTGLPDDLSFADGMAPKSAVSKMYEHLILGGGEIKCLPSGNNNNNNNKKISRPDLVIKHTGEDLFKVKPYPNSRDVENTSWMTMSQINSLVYAPSTKWIEAGSGDIGTIYVEILKCDNLPNLDSGTFGDYTDAFCAIVFEDNLVRTDVICDELHPRWMPWTQRAFAFPVKHPASPIYLGVFDCDSLGMHDPVGRVVINVSNFQDRTVYVLNYKLSLSSGSDENENENDRGTVTVRLRVDLRDKTKKMERTLARPLTKIFLNVSSLKSFRLVKFLCRGEVDLTQPSVSSVRQYKKELYMHIDNLLYLADDILMVLLWRGRILVNIPKPKSLRRKKTRAKKRKSSLKRGTKGASIKEVKRTDKSPTLEKEVRFVEGASSMDATDLIEGTCDSDVMQVSLWFPIRSMFLFQTVILMIEHPRLIPGLCFCYIGMILCHFMVARCNHPLPWHRCKNAAQIFDDLILGGKRHDKIIINEHDGHIDAIKRDKLDKARIERVKKLSVAINAFASKSASDFSNMDMYAYLNSTEEKESALSKLNIMENLLKTPIMYMHMFLMNVCLSMRKIRTIFTWESSYYSCVVMTGCLFSGLFLILFPYEFFLRWSLRFGAWIFLGPGMKLFDMFVFMKYYPPPHKETHALEVPELDFTPIFESPKYKKIAKQNQIAKEDAMKLKGMREYRFGEYTEEVPLFDFSLHPCLPLPTSTARPFLGDEDKGSIRPEYGYEYLPRKTVQWQRFSGQKLGGKMIPHTHVEIIPNKEKES